MANATQNAHSDELTSIQCRLDDTLDLLDRDPAQLQIDDLKGLLTRVRDYLGSSSHNTRLLPTLPEELTDHILSFCDCDTLKAARLVCTSLSRIASPKLFESVHIALAKDILENFLKTASHPNLSQHVKHIVFHGQIPRAFNSQRDWEKHIDLRPYPAKGLPLPPGMFRDDNPFPAGTAAAKAWRETPKHTKNSSELLGHYNAYKSFCHTFSDAIRWLHADKNGRRPDVAANRCNPMRHICEDFPKAIAKLPNLETVELTCHNFDDDGHPFWKAIQKKILMTPSQWKRYYPPGSSRLIYDQVDYHMEGVVQLSMLLKALGDASGKNKLRSLSIAAERDPFWIQEHLWDPADLHDPNFADSLAHDQSYTSLFKTMATSMSTLTNLDLDISYRLSGNHSLIADRLSQFLRAAPNLERLRLDFMEGDWEGREEGTERCDLLARLQDIEWPRLKSLRLEVITASNTFLGFLKRVAPTLRSLDLYHVSLVHGSGYWEEVIAQLPRILELDAVKLDSLWDSKFQYPRYEDENGSMLGDEFGRYLLENAGWNEEPDCYIRALQEFITRKNTRMPALDEEDFWEEHQCSECGVLDERDWSSVSTEDDEDSEIMGYELED